MNKISRMGGALLGGALIGTSLFSGVQAQVTGSLASQNLRALTQEARMLTIQASLKPEDRPAFQKLMADRRSLERAMQSARQNRLVAYIQALKSGQSVQQARQDAKKAERGTSGLKAQAQTVRQEAQALAKKYPKLAKLLLAKAHHHKLGKHGHKKGALNRGGSLMNQSTQPSGQTGPHPRLHHKGKRTAGSASGTSGDSSGQ